MTDMGEQEKLETPNSVYELAQTIMAKIVDAEAAASKRSIYALRSSSV